MAIKAKEYYTLEKVEELNFEGKSVGARFTLGGVLGNEPFEAVIDLNINALVNHTGFIIKDWYDGVVELQLVDGMLVSQEELDSGEYADEEYADSDYADGENEQVNYFFDIITSLMVQKGAGSPSGGKPTIFI